MESWRACIHTGLIEASYKCTGLIVASDIGKNAPLDVSVSPVWYLFALKREARGVRRADVRIEVIGMGPDAARANTERLLRDSPPPALIVSVGICGGLRDGLNVGDIIVPCEVVTVDRQSWKCEPIALPATGRLLSVNRLVSSVEEKRRLHIEHAADIVDMEAASIAAICAERGIPFAAIKAISDTATDSLPTELEQFAPNGHVRIGQLLLAIAKRPRLIADLLRLQRTTSIAIARLGLWAATP